MAVILEQELQVGQEDVGGQAPLTGSVNDDATIALEREVAD